MPLAKLKIPVQALGLMVLPGNILGVKFKAVMVGGSSSGKFLNYIGLVRMRHTRSSTVQSTSLCSHIYFLACFEPGLADLNVLIS